MRAPYAVWRTWYSTTPAWRSERRAEHVRVDPTTVVVEHVVEPALDVRHAAVRRPARARLGQDRHLVGDLVADQRQRAVEQVRQIDLGRPLSRRDRPAVVVDRLDDQQIVAQVRPRVIAGDADAAALRRAPRVPDRTPQASSAAVRISGSSGSEQLRICRGAIRNRPARASKLSTCNADG